MRNTLICAYLVFLGFTAGWFSRLVCERTVTGATLQMRSTAPTLDGDTFQPLGHFTLVHRDSQTDTLVVDACRDFDAWACDYMFRLLIEKQ